MSDYNINEKELHTSDTEEPVRVLAVGVYETDNEDAGSEEDFIHSMDELDELIRSCNMFPAGRVTQNLAHINPATYVGYGKIEEIKMYVQGTDSEGIIVNDTLTPSQLRNLQKELELPVMDRTALILEIFKSRARTREARLQVEYANLNYIRTRLVGMWDTLGRKGGASGAQSSRGEGETQLELDRRAIDRKLAELRRELKEINVERESQRKKRHKSKYPLVSLVGYTNAGKSTIMNSLIDKYSSVQDKKVFEANMLFATLDTTVRKIEPDNHNDFLLSDTVGFIHKLPTGLVEAFNSTLDEVREADLILHVVDCSDKKHPKHMQVTNKTISDLGAGHIPQLIVYNKADLCDPPTAFPKDGKQFREGSTATAEIYISAKDDDSLEFLVDAISKALLGERNEVEFVVPYDKGAVVSDLNENARIIATEYLAEGTLIKVSCSRDMAEKYEEYIRNK